ncbi:S9 family peptidase [Gabonibacter chumensis]|uniref:S9 family peptidase n=1 Tax=Gabonibacter chumensis TaxID=2972474 RepID=UPI0025735B8C|nr:DPP IV N-terminal domain-containing protein [Gabonibacter chumensis]MCR9013140.1 DPP IV N-terminal domain-containing protein [Gabonibacter chumensis]
MRSILICILLSGIVFCSTAQQKANYELAERFRSLTRVPIVKNSLEIRPRYINNTDRFWYDFRTEEGNRYYLVDPSKKSKRLLFDNAELLMKISEITRKAYSDKELDINFEFAPDGKTIYFNFDRNNFAYNTETKVLKTEEKARGYYSSSPYWMYYCADSSYMLFAKRHNLYVVGNAEKGKDTTEVQLTKDGERYYTFNREDEGEIDDRFGCSAKWFKQGHKFYAIREDSRLVKELWLVDALAEPRPKLKTYKAELAGDEHVIQYELLIGDADKGEVKKIDISRWKDQYIDVLYTSNDGKRLYFQRYKRTWDECEICCVDTENGEVKVLIHEVDKPYLDYQMRSISFLNDGKEILFRSERSGWGHYYLYDENGNLKNQVTSGAWVAGPIMKIDTVKRQIYFIGLGKEANVDPYYYVLYRADIDKTNAITLLTPENATHDISLSPSCNYFTDSYSRVDMEPVNVVRDRKGRVIMELEKPDLRRLYELGWKKPERFKVKAADGVTDLYGTMWKPADFDSTKCYPIISSVYPGPFFEYVQTRFTLNDDLNTRLAQVGFIVISVGHRGGTPMRGKFYHTYGYGNQRDYPLADDKYVIEQLADRHAYINGKKVGIFGHSGGGFMSTAALLTYPDFYSAAVSSAGNHDNNIYNKGFVEIHYGVKENKKIVKDSVNGDREEITFTTKSKSNAELAKNYKGGLLIVTGDMDKTVHPSHTLRVVDALIKAGKNFDMLVLPGNTHGFSGEAEDFFERKLWFHFAKHLLEDDSADYEGDINYFMKR